MTSLRLYPGFGYSLKITLVAACVTFMTLVQLLVPGRAVAQTQSAIYQIKASYIFNFLQFVSFPQGSISDDQLKVCILGENRFGNALKELDGAQTPQGKIHVVRLGRFTSSLNIRHCHLLYVVDSEAAATESILAKASLTPMLTIGESEGFLEQGGLIQLVEQNDLIRFRINKQLANKSNLTIDAQLIQLSLE